MAQSSDMLVVSEVEIETILRRWGVYWALLYIVYYRRSVTIREEIKSMEQEAQHSTQQQQIYQLYLSFIFLDPLRAFPPGAKPSPMMGEKQEKRTDTRFIGSQRDVRVMAAK